MILSPSWARATPAGSIALVSACLSWWAMCVKYVRLDEFARELLANRGAIPVCDQVLAPIDGRSGVVATQGAA